MQRNFVLTGGKTTARFTGKGQNGFISQMLWPDMCWKAGMRFEKSINTRSALMKYFCRHWCSGFAEKLAADNFRNDYKCILYKIDWKRGNPYVFTIDDYDELVDSGMLFARKFSEDNWDVVMRIQEACMGAAD